MQDSSPEMPVPRASTSLWHRGEAGCSAGASLAPTDRSMVGENQYHVDKQHRKHCTPGWAEDRAGVQLCCSLLAAAQGAGMVSDAATVTHIQEDPLNGSTQQIGTGEALCSLLHRNVTLSRVKVRELYSLC